MGLWLIRTCHAEGVNKPRVFFATIAAGGGHVATARAMAQSLGAVYPGAFETQVSDYMLELGRRHPGVRTFDQRHKALWKVILAHPRLARYGQRVLDAAPASPTQVISGCCAPLRRLWLRMCVTGCGAVHPPLSSRTTLFSP